MSNEFKRPRDAFTFSLGGLATVTMVAFSPAIPDDRINRLRDEELKRRRGHSPDGQRFWRRLRRQPAWRISIGRGDGRDCPVIALPPE